MANKLKQIAKKIPVLSSLYKALRNRLSYRQLKSKTTEQVFTDIYENNTWGGKDSVSGPGSDIHQTRNIIKEFPPVFEAFDISTMLDIPCGDFHWMKNVDFGSIEYTGADIVNDLVEENRSLYAGENIHFEKMDIIKSELPKVDLVFCRDCLVHLSFDDIFRALNNICNSQSGYFLTTTFTERTKNHDIATGQWRPLSFELAPFNLPKPIRVINEACTEGDGTFRDKVLGLWRIADIQESLT